MSLTKRVISAFLVLVMLFSVLYLGNQKKEQDKMAVFDNTRTLHVWYTDEALTDYISSMAVKYNEEHGVRVIPTLQSGLELLQKINEASLTSEYYPDLYIASNDNMEKAYLAGLAMEISDEESAVSLQNFPESAMHAVTYQQKILGYPFYYETSALLYNMTYLEELAKSEIQEEMKVTVEKAEETEEKNEEETSEEEQDVTVISEEEMAELVHEKVPSLIPTTFETLLEFADSYDAPQNVEAVFKWDVEDIFFNYFFAGNYMDIGGMCGDSKDSVDIYNEEAIRALMVYQDLSDYFAIDAGNVEYDSVIQEFMEGKVVMTTATTDIIKKLNTAKENGEFIYDYGIAPIPRLNEQMDTKSLSVTNTIYINGYTQMKEEANDFARYMVIQHAEDLYNATGKVPANKNVRYDNPNLDMFMDEYQDSAPMPKLMAISNFWVKMEIMFESIWNGEDVSKELKELSEDIKTKLTGNVYEETYIKVEVEEEEVVDYSDD
ncbi:MAG: extracellular solute-binding protein [Lachnospiraceae bacterium]|nr:extracellular solute-binding protein [Lachnospiraceae bacterium]